MDLLAGIETRRSIRAFKSTAIPREILEQVLKAASRSPSYTNTQPWEVAVVTGRKKEELSKMLLSLASAGAPSEPDLPMPGSWPEELARRSREHSAKRFKAIGVQRENEEQRRDMRLRNFNFYGAPCAIFLFIDRTLSSWSIFDMGIFAQSLILAAHSFGLGSCLQGMLAIYPDTVREFLGIPESKLLLIGISLGYPDAEASINSYRSERAGTAEFVRWYE